MSATWFRRVSPAAMGLAVLVLIALLLVSVPVDGDTETPAPSVGAGVGAADFPPIGAVFSGVTMIQQFPSGGARIRSVALWLAATQRTAHGTAHITVQRDVGGQWRDLGTQTFETQDAKADAYETVNFSAPLEVMRGQPVRITVTADGGPNDAIIWQVNPTSQPDGYALIANDRVQQGTARFLVTYAPADGRIIQLIGPIWQRITVFLSPLWMMMLALGFVILTGGVLYIGYVLVR